MGWDGARIHVLDRKRDVPSVKWSDRVMLSKMTQICTGVAS